MILTVLQSSTILLIAFAAVSLIGRRLSAATRHWILTVALFASAVVPLLGPVVPSWNRQTQAAPRQNAGRRGLYARVQDQTEMFLNLNAGVKPAPTRTPRRFSYAAAIWISGTSIALILIIGGIFRMSVLTRKAQCVGEGRCATTLAESLAIFWDKTTDPAAAKPARNPRHMGHRSSCCSTSRGRRHLVRRPLAHRRHTRTGAHQANGLAGTNRCRTGKSCILVQSSLFWFLCRRLRSESELACDDVVLNAGYDAGEYATHLLELARASKTRGRTWSPVLAMAQPPHLERRFIAMLNPSINRTPVNRAAVIVTCVLALLVTIPLAAVQAREEIKPPLIASPPAAPGTRFRC